MYHDDFEKAALNTIFKIPSKNTVKIQQHRIYLFCIETQTLLQSHPKFIAFQSVQISLIVVLYRQDLEMRYQVPYFHLHHGH